jgi:hypothetical protein
MTLDQFIGTLNGQAVLYAPSPARESLRGQCVQLACFYVQEVPGTPVMWADAIKWYTSGQFADRYDRIAYNGSNRPQRGDLVVWGQNLPNSGGNGHIGICLSTNGNFFTSFDSNWGGRYAHQVTHDYNYVLGWVRPRFAAPAPQAQEGPEMIATRQEAVEIYCLLRPNGGPSEAELGATVGRRSYASFLKDAQAEVNARNAALAGQQDGLTRMQAQINQQNQAITELNTQLADARLSNQQKQQAFNDAMGKITTSNTALATAHDQITDLQKQVEDAERASKTKISEASTVSAPKVTPFVRLLAWVIKPHNKA